MLDYKRRRDATRNEAVNNVVRAQRIEASMYHKVSSPRDTDGE